jgi:hypothetical protein
VSKIVQKYFKKLLTLPCRFEILASHTVTLKINRIQKMRTKTLLLACAALAFSLATSQAQVYSANVVGYINQSLSSAQNLIEVPFTMGSSNGANEVFGSVLPDGTTLLIFNQTAGKYVTYYYDTGAGFNPNPWLMGDDATPTNPPYLPAGKGFFIQPPGGANVTYVGSVAVNYNASITNTLASAQNLVGTLIPVAGPVTNALVNLGPTLPDGTTFLIYNQTTGKYITYYYDTGAGFNPNPWLMADDATPTNPVSLSIAQGFFIQPPGGATWVQTFIP